MKPDSKADFLPHFQVMCAKAVDFLELTKPKLTTLVLFATLVGFCIGSHGSISLGLLINTLIGAALASGGAAAFNMYAERGVDARMIRTVSRPLPSGRIRSKSALFFSIAAATAGFFYLHFFVNHLTSFLSAIIVAGYLILYTPLKMKTSLSTLAGAVPGALPIVMGWAAASGALTLHAWALFSIVFLWQIPHFHSISWMHREDYIKAGIPVLSAIDASGRRTGRQVVLFISVLILCTLLLAGSAIGGMTYLAGSLALGSIFLFYGILFARRRDRDSACRLFAVSALYLPSLFILLLLERFSHR
jgi:heme o synthase